MVNLGEQALLKLDVVDLLQVDDLGLFECFKRDWLAVEQGQVDLAKRARANHTNQCKVSDLTVRVLYVPPRQRLAWHN